MFHDDSHDETGSQARFEARPAHPVYWVVHNCVAHPLIGLIPVKPFFDFHDWTSKKINEPKKKKPKKIPPCSDCGHPEDQHYTKLRLGVWGRGCTGPQFEPECRCGDRG